MAKYMLILGGADLDKRSADPEFRKVMLERYMGWVRSIEERGQFVSSSKLHDKVGARLTIRAGQVTDGPFVETKEAVGGILVVEVPTLEEATAIGRKCPVLDLQNGYVEVRQVEEIPRPGR
jgi:hypothetical protein